MLQAVLFDLDDTLVIADNEALMSDYFRRLARLFKDRVEPERLAKQVMSSTMHTITNPDGKSKTQAIFEQHFFNALNLPVDMSVFLDFYADEYGELGCYAHPRPGARQAVQAAIDLNLAIVLATNPVFPRIAVNHRLRWAGLEDINWRRVTSIENTRFCKPHPQYYTDIAAYIGVAPGACLMVGDDIYYDLPAARTDMRTFLLTPEATRSETGTVLPAGDEQKTYPPTYTGALTDLPALLQQLVRLQTPNAQAACD